MARINLLPWRETLRAERKREFGFMLIGGAVIAGAGVHFGQSISHYSKL